jgi:putative transposase
MSMLLSHKIALRPNQKQLDYFRRAAGTARFVWNQALAAWEETYRVDGKVNIFKLERDFNARKAGLFPWITEVSSHIPNRAFANLRRAFDSFFRKLAKHPKFKSRHRSRDSFYVHNSELKLDGRHLFLQKRLCLGPIRMCESIRFTGKVMGATVSREADQWFIAVQVDVGKYARSRTGDGCVGIDIGVKSLAVLSTGETIEGPKPLKKALKSLCRRSRQHSRKAKGSNNRSKSARKLAKLHARISHIRADFLHRLTTRLCRENQAVAIEDLNVRGMMQSRLARSVGDAGFGVIRRQLGYKSPIFGTEIKVADRWFPSTQTCSECGMVKKVKLTLVDRVFVCDACGYEAGRDFNASRNLRNLIPVNCGEFTPVERKALARPKGWAKPRLAEAGILLSE